MKRMLFGSVLFIGGLIGALFFVALAFCVPVSYNFNDYNSIFVPEMVVQGTIVYFIIFCIVALAGVMICVYEAYLKDFIAAKKDKNK
jgi:hypothetical protein